MGLMDSPAASGRLIVTPHPVLVDGQRNQPADLRPGESLCNFLHRHVSDLDDQDWVVLIGGRAVPRDMWPFVYPKHGQVIEARGAVGRSAVALVATLALTYFTFGFGALATWGAGAAVQGLGAAAATGIYMAGSVLINRVLQPKQPKQSAPGQSAYSIAAGRNRARHEQPVGLLIGSMRIAPDLISNYYTHYEGDDQFLSFVLTPGVNVHSVEQLYNGDALLSSFDGVRVWHNGFPGMPSVEIPLYTNPDVTDGGTLLDTSNDPKHQPSAWVQRTSSAGTIRLMVGVEFQLWDRTTKGKDKLNSDQIQIQYRAAGTANWQVFGNYNVRGTNNKSQRASYAIDVPDGQYDVRVRVAGNNTDGSGAEASFVWTTLTSVQRDPASYTGIPRIGIRMQANGQLNGAPDEIRCVAHSMPIPVWTGSEWMTQRTSNAGAWILAYARGIYAPDPSAPGGRVLVAGMGLPERQIDLEGLKAFMLHCAANNFTYNNWITDVRSHQQVLDVLALAGFGQISWPRGRLSAGWAADEQPLSGVVNMATIKKGQFQVDYTLTNGADGIEYTYLDSATWQSKTLRVPAPGVTTMLNPAQVSGEGVTTEAHAVMLARWHLAQSLYQYKAISYSTDIEHLSYSRMSMLALQHDMTQWGFGGRIMGAALVNGRMVLELDEPVPGRPEADAFVGLRIPGERVYRVLKVAPFAGTAKELTLVDPWPRDAAVPGDTEANPAWDTLWIYDFKQTPGLRVRVTSIRPESDLKGAAVEVVAESREFWHYVHTGEYIPSPNESLLQTRPVASDLKITERQVVQGDTEFTELQATFAISGPAGDTVVLSDTDGNGELEQVARTVTRTATWRIPGAGTYPITVRPYSPDGNAGVAASLIYTTRGADAPPVLVDFFDVEQLSGGVRRYSWGFFSDTIRSANFAGVEIRYHPGTEPHTWEQMTALGDDGYHPSAFEAVLPEAGVWTFAIRSRNTAGTLSTQALVISKTLQANLGEVIDGLDGRIDETYEQAQEANNRITQEILNRVADVQRIGDAAALDATQKADAARNAAIAHADVIGAQVADITGADEWIAGVTYPQGDLVRRLGVLYRAKTQSISVPPETDAEAWEKIGNYSSLGEAVAASVSISTQNATDIAVEATKLEAVRARMPAGQSLLATTVDVAAEQTARIDGDAALGQRTALVEARMPTGSDKLANEARVLTTEQASVARDSALGTRVDNVISLLPPDGGQAASWATVNSVDMASAFRDNALGERINTTNANVANKADSSTVQAVSSKVALIGEKVDANAIALTQVTSKLGSTPNMLKDSSFARGFAYWSQPGMLGIANEPRFGNYMYGPPVAGGTASAQTVQTGEGVYVFSGEVYRNSNGGTMRLEVAAYSAAGYIGATSALSDSSIVGKWQQIYIAIAAPAGTTYLVCRAIWENTNANHSVRRMKLELGLTPTLWTDDTAAQLSATATQILETRATQLENGLTRVEAKAGVLLDVNGRVIGWLANNDGAQGIFDVVADRFNVTDPNGTGSTTFEQGRWVTRSGGYMQVHGKPFGTTGDLMHYIGIGSDPNAASKANGIFWIDNKGNSHFGGSLSAGTLKNDVRTTSTAGNAEIINGPFSTLGRQKSVVVSYSLRKTDTANTGTWNPPSGSVNATIYIYRKVGNGPEQMINSFVVNGAFEVLNETGGPSKLVSTMNGSHTFNDNTPGTDQFTYRAILISRNVAASTPSSGTVNVEIQQNLGIISVEQ